MSDTATERPRRRLLAISVRALIVLVLVIGGVLGWITHRARVVREAAEAIEQAGGVVAYDWQHRGNRVDLKAEPGKFRRALGPGYFEEITDVLLNQRDMDKSRVDDSLMEEIGRLGHVQKLWIVPSAVTDAGMVHLKGLHDLRDVRFGSAPATGRCLAYLEGARHLQQLSLSYMPVTDADLSHLAGLDELETLSLIRAFPGDIMMGTLRIPPSPDYLVHDTDPARPSGPFITNDGLAHLEKLTRLKHLDLIRTDITSTGLAHLRTLRACYEL